MLVGSLLNSRSIATGPVTSLKFNTKQVLLASGSSDRTAKVLDMHRFELVAQTLPESNSVRSVLFHFNEVQS